MIKFSQYLKEISSNWKPPKKNGFGKFGRFGDRIPDLAKLPKELEYQKAKYNEIPVVLGYDVYNVFQRYWGGQTDPLYSLLTKRGDSVDIKTVDATPEEMARLKEVAEEILRNSSDKGELRTANNLLKQLERI